VLIDTAGALIIVGIQLGGSVKIIRWLHFLHFLMLFCLSLYWGIDRKCLFF
jgi:hypothetical protein